MNPSNDNFVTIGDLWHQCVAHWRWFAASVVICFLFAVRYILTAPYLYTRSASIMVREDVVGSNATEKNSKDFSDIGFLKQKSNLTDVLRHITSLDVLVEVTHRLGKPLEEGEDIIIAEGIQARLSVECENDKTNIIDLTYKDSSTYQAERVLLLIIQVYNEKWIEHEQDVIRSSSQFIDDKLSILERELNLVDDSISSFKSSYGITDLSRVSDMYLQQQSQTDAEILQLMNQKAMAEYIRSLLEDESSQQQLLLVNSGINNTLIESQITLYNSLLLQMQSHMEYTSGQNPLIINLTKELNSLRKNILSNVINHIRTIEIQLQSLQEYHSLTTSKITSNPDQAKHLISIEREQKVKESLYMFLLQKKEENEISLTYKSAPSQIINAPHGSGKPTSPKRFRILFAAIFLGFLLPFSVIFLRIIMDENVRNRFDIEREGDIPFLGEIPQTEQKSSLLNMLKRLKSKPQSPPIVVADGQQDPVNEAFRMIRTRLETINNSHPHQKVYLVTSSSEGVGKTFVAMNLALALAVAKKHVLFIDGDLRKSTASHKWNMSGMGLTDYLAGRVRDIQTVLCHPDGFPTLDVLPAGAKSSNPTELLSGTLLEAMLSSASSNYDYVLIDTPPMGRLADAEIIAKSANDTLFVIRAGMFERRNLDELKEQHHENQYVILNGVRKTNRGDESYC